MRAILKDDIIISLVMSSDEVTEIGSIPKNIGLGRLRFDGDKVININNLNQIWVDTYKILHCIDTGNCQLVDMTYSDRYDLITTDTGWRLKTTQEKIDEQEVKNENKKSNKLKQRIRQEYASEVQYKIARDKCFWILVDYALTGDLKYQTFLQNNLNKVKNILGIE